MNPSSTIAREAVNKCVRIHADGVNLLGDLQIPEESQSIIIFAYCGGRTRNNPRCLLAGRILRNHGFSTLVCDLMTEDEETEDEATEKYRLDAGLLAKRLTDITRWVESEPDTRELRIGYLGACSGAAAALIAAAGLRDVVGAVVSRGGRMDLATNFLHRVKCPTLLIVGENDPLGIEQSREALKHLVCEKQLREIPGASHMFGEPGKLDEAVESGAAWFRTHLGENHSK